MHLQRHNTPPTKEPSTDTQSNLSPTKCQHTHSQAAVCPNELAHRHIIQYDPQNPTEHAQSREDIVEEEEEKEQHDGGHDVALIS